MEDAGKANYLLLNLGCEQRISQFLARVTLKIGSTPRELFITDSGWR
jgi:hypothetical protein